jgi:hypothetical protein
MNAEMDMSGVDRYAFFGKRFEVSFDDPSFRRLFRSTYRALHAEEVAQPPSATFSLFSMNRRVPELIVTADHRRLVDVFTSGTNRLRFAVRDVSTNGEPLFEISDAFLGKEPVMAVSGRRAQLLDAERCYSTTESIIFHTVLSLIPNYHIMHAGVVAWREKAVLLCGEANRGKTTLTLGLVRAGWKFLSDEIAFIDVDRCTVAPFPRAIGMRENSIPMFPEIRQEHLIETKSLAGEPKWLVDVGAVFPGTLAEETSIAAIVLLDGFGSSPNLTPLPASEAMFDCVKVTHSAEDDPMKMMLNVAEIVNRTRCVRLRAGTVTDTAAALTEMMA